MEFQVTSSSAATGKNDIVTRIYSPPPTLSILYESDLENDGSFNGEAEENGDYKVCFDNRVSTWSDKILWFEVKVEDPETAIHDVRMKVGKMRHFQFMRGGSMSKDTHQVESNLSRLNFWSLAHLLLMLVVGVSQVYLVRQLFDEKSIVQKVSTRA